MSKRKTNNFTDADYVVKQSVKEPEETFEETPTEPEPVTEQLVEPTAITIEEIPIPKRNGRKAVLSYPISSLTPDSERSFFLVALGNTVKTLTTSVRTFASRNGFKVIVRPVDGGIRVWRKA